MVSIGLEALRSGMRTGPGSQLGLWLFGGLLGGGRSFGRGREVVRSDGRPTVDGDLGLSLDGRSRGWVNRWVGRSVGSNSLVVALCPGRSRASRGARIEIAICHWSADLDLSSFRSGPRDERLIMTYRIML